MQRRGRWGGRGFRTAIGVVTVVALCLLASGLVTWSGVDPAARWPGAGIPPRVATTNPWLRRDRRVLNQAHSGGEHEAPMNTRYAFTRAVDHGATMIELDVQSTADGQVVVIHDATVDATTNGTGRVVDKSLAEVQALDAAWWFAPDHSSERHDLPATAYPLRGARGGGAALPAGARPDDFRIPTLAEVLAAFPSIPVNIEIKGSADGDVDSYRRTGRLVADVLARSGRTDVIVVSFNDDALAQFHRLAPNIPLAAARKATMNYVLFGRPLPEGTVALQVPIGFLGLPVVTRPFVRRAHADGYAVHAWFSGSAPDDEATYRRVLATCVDGLMPAYPTLATRVMAERGTARPGHPGTDDCS